MQVARIEPPGAAATRSLPMKRAGRSCAWLLAAALGLVTGEVRAADPPTKFVTVDLTGSGYQISYYDDPSKWIVNDISFAALVENGGFFGTLTKKVTFLGTDPFVIKFSQKAPPANYSATNTGFKVRLDFTLTNGKANTKWTSFSEQLKDADFEGVPVLKLDGVDRGSASHPLFAHFHPKDFDMANFKSNPFKKTTPADFDALAAFTANDGEVTTGNAWTANGLFLHAMDIKGLPRTFSLIETPVAVAVPEPPAWVLLGAGFCLFVVLKRRVGAEPHRR